jgi:hypothetical protein
MLQNLACFCVLSVFRVLKLFSTRLQKRKGCAGAVYRSAPLRLSNPDLRSEHHPDSVFAGFIDQTYIQS